MIKWLERKMLKNKIAVITGDRVILKYNDKNSQRTICDKEITEHMTADEAGVFEFEDELGMERGVGGVIGESKKPGEVIKDD